MANLRIRDIAPIDNLNLTVSFNDNLRKDIGISNLSIESLTPGVENPQIQNIEISGDTILINCQPLTALAFYNLVLSSTDDVLFSSLNGDSVLLQDGVANVKSFIAPVEESNPVKEQLVAYLRNNVYNIESGTNIDKYLSALSLVFSRALYDIKQTANENYLTKTVRDEVKVRGATAFDRLNEEGAYEVLRVGKNPTDADVSMTLSIDNFDNSPISLLQTETEEILSVVSTSIPSSFNINNLVLQVSKSPVIKVNSILFTYTDGRNPYEYNIDGYGYQVLDGKYDKKSGYTYLQLDSNQIKINDLVLSDSAFSLENIHQVRVSFFYKDTGRVIDENSVVVSSVLSSGREALPPLQNIFNLKHSLIVSEIGESGKIGDVKFVDQNALYILNAKHPAFKNEILFRLDSLPSRPGDYSIDYETGAVYVYGESAALLGTGGTPPLAIYNYRLEYVQDSDFSLEEDTFNLVALPDGNLINNGGKVTFNFEQVLARDVDYKAALHSEALNERVENRLISLNTLTTKNHNITNVFRVYNESSGEIYNTTRWSNNKVYFSYNNPPAIRTVRGEKASFEDVFNEVISIRNVSPHTPSLSIFTIELSNNNITSATEDSIGSSINSSLSFSKGVFNKEIYFNPLSSLGVNLNRLINRGDYQVDYVNGIVYLLEAYDMPQDIGTVSYKTPYIRTSESHVISVSDIYYQLNATSDKDSNVDYISFDDRRVLPKTFAASDEQSFTGIPGQSNYLMLNGEIGTIDNSGFVPGVKDNVKYVRGLYEIEDLINNSTPINFAPYASTSDKIILVPSISKSEYTTVQADGSNRVVYLNTESHYHSPNITLNISVKNNSNNSEIWNNSGVIAYGDKIKLILPSGSASTGDSVTVSYSFKINDLSHVAIDYSRGGLFISYEYLADEIVVSYEYGDNVLDFRQSSAIEPGETYYATYKVGALRSALLKNFGILINIDLLNNFDVLFDRERYRDGITAALHSLASGPTKATIEKIAKTISHLPAKVIESTMSSWSLGSSILFSDEIKNVGSVGTSKGRHGVGALIDEKGKSLSIPAIGNLRLEEGTFEAWIKNNWDGLDNEATLTFSVLKNGTPLSANQIFVGAGGAHPRVSYSPSDGYYFSVNRDSIIFGEPNKSKTGLFIYQKKNGFTGSNKWYASVSDGYSTNQYLLTIKTDGKFYDIHSTGLSQPQDRIISTQNKVLMNVTSPSTNKSLSFFADRPHFIVDVGSKENESRLSIFKDESGYVNLRAIDKFGSTSVVSANVSSWKKEEKHHVAASWKINTIFGRDELHLFIDGKEVPNIIRYGENVKPGNNEKWRTVRSEQIVTTSTKNIVGSIDLLTHAGSPLAYSSLNFSAYGVSIGDKLFIDETGFSSTGYTIANINGNTLTLSTSMPASISNGKFSINRLTVPVRTEIDLFPRVSVSALRLNGSETELMGPMSLHPDYELIRDGYHQSQLTLLNGVNQGDNVFVNTYGLNHRKVKRKYYVWGNQSSIIKTKLPAPISLNNVSFKRIIQSPVLTTTGNSVVPEAQPNVVPNGRTLNVFINKLSASSVTVTLTGMVIDPSTVSPVPGSETLSFTGTGMKGTTKQFTQISSFSTSAPALIEIKEKYSISILENGAGALSPSAVVRYAYQMHEGNKLASDGYGNMTDGYSFFSKLLKGQNLVVHNPSIGAGYYPILDVSDDHSSMTVGKGNNETYPAAFTNGQYEVLNVVDNRSGLQNGYFFFEFKNLPGTPLNLRQGLYEIEYYTYLTVPFNISGNIHFGSDIFGNNQLNGTIDDIQILSDRLLSNRIGEVVPSGVRTITKDFNSVRPKKVEEATLFLSDFSGESFKNVADIYLDEEKRVIQSSNSVNDKFGKSLVLTSNTLAIDNDGVLNSSKEGTIEFWVNPIFDSNNDPNDRYYIDASSIVTEELVSSNRISIVLTGKAERITSIKSSTGIDFMAGAVLSSDKQTIALKSRLPNQNTKVLVSYVPNGLKGDRISIFKDKGGYLNFEIFAAKSQYLLRAPTYWKRDSWHRVRASWKVNSRTSNDEMHLFVDGYEYGNLLVNNTLSFSGNLTFGTPRIGFTNPKLSINFSDPVNQIFIGSDFLKKNVAFALMDNLRISNIMRPIYKPFGESIDPTYSTNIDVVYPMVSDLNTTYLLDSETEKVKNTDFAILNDRNSRLSDYTVEVRDNLELLLRNDKSKQILEKLISNFGPANSRAYINYSG